MAVQASTLELKIITARPNNYLVSNFETAGGKTAIGQRVVDYLQRVVSGNELAYGLAQPPSIAINIRGNATPASGTVIFSAINTANDTFLINGVTLTCVASGATNNQWNVGTTATTQAANFAAAVNASTTNLITGQVIATAASGTVTITSLWWGLSGNQCTIAKGTDAGTVMTVSGARLTGGAVDATAQTLTF